MSRDAFLALAGPRLVHVTPARNAPGLAAMGLCRPATLARLAGRDPAGIALRRETVTLITPAGVAELNHQRPLLAGHRQAFLDGTDLAGWAAALDRRVFFWPGRARAAFDASLSARSPSLHLHLDAGALYDLFADRLDLSPINSGNATRRAAPRGDWLYVPATEAERFRDNRRTRGLKRSPDSLVELSLRDDIAPDVLSSVLKEVVWRSGNSEKVGRLSDF